MDTGFTSEGLEHIHAAAEKHVGDTLVPGLVALVARAEHVHVETLGSLTIGGAPVRRDSLFRIASTTKPLTAAPTLAIVDDGLIGLDEPVDRLLPELADRQVLRRMDGPLHDIVPAERAITTRDVQPDSDTWIANLGTLPLLAKPGERWMYNTGASVLGVLLERVTGTPFPDVLRDKVTAPWACAARVCCPPSTTCWRSRGCCSPAAGGCSPRRTRVR